MAFRQNNVRSATALVVVLIGALALAGCGTQEPQDQARGPEDRFGGTLKVAITAYPTGMDPFTGWYHLGAMVYYHVAEQLLTYDENWAITPLLAEDYYSNEDYTEWTFELRRGVKFHNGTEMTSVDVEVSIRRFLETSPRASDLAVVDRIETPDEYTVRLVLSEPLAILPVQIAYPMAGVFVLPAEVLAEVDEPLIPPDKLVGTGPYVLDEAIPDRHVRLVRFEDYVPNEEHFSERSGYGGKKTAYLDEILLIPVPEPASRTAGLLAGDYDFAQDVPKSDYDAIEAAEGCEVLINPAQWRPSIHFRHSGGLFSQLEYRRAVQYAVDIDEVMLAVAERPDFYRLDSSMYFRETVWHHPAGDITGLYNVADPDQARDLLAESGYDGRRVILVTNTDYDWMYRAGVVVTEQLKRAGLNVEMRVFDWPTAINVRETSDQWDMFISGDSLAPDATLNNYWHSDVGWLGYSNPEIDRLLEEGMKYADFESRFPIYCELGEAMYEDATYLLFGDLHEIHAQSERVNGFALHTQLRLWDVWLED